MKKTLLTFMLISCLVLACGSIASADDTSFGVSARIDPADAVTYEVTKILADGTWTDEHPTALDFGTLGYDAENGILRAAHYFAIDMGVTVGGAGAPDDISFTYVDLNNPNDTTTNGRGGLGKKGTLQVTKAEEGEPDLNVGSKVVLEDVASLGTIGKETFPSPTWPRLYVGLYDGNNDADDNGVPDNDVTGWEIFTTEDAPGDYLGTLTVSAVVN